MSDVRLYTRRDLARLAAAGIAGMAAGELVAGPPSRARGLLALRACNCRPAQPPEGGMNALYLRGTLASVCKASLGPVEMGDRTISLWACIYKYRASGTMRQHCLFTLCGSSRLGTISYAGDVIWISNRTSPAYQFPGVGIREFGNVEYGKWFHVALRANGTALSVFLNGVLAETFRWNGAPAEFKISNPVNLSLGAMPWNDGNVYDCMNGKLANVQFFDRALSDAEIALLGEDIGAALADASHAWRFASGDGVLRDTGAIGGWDVDMGAEAMLVGLGYEPEGGGSSAPTGGNPVYQYDFDWYEYVGRRTDTVCGTWTGDMQDSVEFTFSDEYGIGTVSATYNPEYGYWDCRYDGDGYCYAMSDGTFCLYEYDSGRELFFGF